MNDGIDKTVVAVAGFLLAFFSILVISISCVKLRQLEVCEKSGCEFRDNELVKVGAP